MMAFISVCIRYCNKEHHLQGSKNENKELQEPRPMHRAHAREAGEVIRSGHTSFQILSASRHFCLLARSESVSHGQMSYNPY
jgi:hypothetical protein